MWKIIDPSHFYACIAGKILEKIMGAYQLVLAALVVYHTIWYMVIDIMLIKFCVSSNLFVAIV